MRARLRLAYLRRASRVGRWTGRHKGLCAAYRLASPKLQDFIPDRHKNNSWRRRSTWLTMRFRSRFARGSHVFLDRGLGGEPVAADLDAPNPAGPNQQANVVGGETAHIGSHGEGNEIVEGWGSVVHCWHNWTVAFWLSACRVSRGAPSQAGHLIDLLCHCSPSARQTIWSSSARTRATMSCSSSTLARYCCTHSSLRSWK